MPVRPRCLPRMAVSVVALLLSAFALARADSVWVQCAVFEDVDGDGVSNAEPGLSGVRITNGVDIFTTDGFGEIAFPVDRTGYRFATMTIPAGYRATTSWFAHLDGLADTVTVSFGLQVDPASATDPVRWVHIADTQVQTWGDPFRMDDVLLEVNEIPQPPLFLLNAGDLVETGSDTTHWNNYMAQMAVSDFEVLPVVGNHDTLGTANPLDYYEQYMGPPYYSREAGSWHFIIYNSEVVGTPLQDTWLTADMAAAPPGTKFVVAQHRMLKEAPAAKNAAWASMGIRANFSGHWHALQLAPQPHGMLDLNLSRTRSGPLDRTPQVFGVVTMEADGNILYDLRRVHVNHRTEITHPAPAQTLARGEAMEVMVQSYDTSSPVVAVVASVSGPGGVVAPKLLAAEGVSLWRGDVDVSRLPYGTYTLSVTATYDDGQVRNKVTSFTLGNVIPITREPSADWPMFRKCLAGSSSTVQAVEPPLTLAWSTPASGLVGLSSPVVSGGRVYLGTRAEHEVGEEGVLACDATTGSVVWNAHVPGGIALAPAVAGNVVMASALSDSVWGLDVATGQVLWNRLMPGTRYCMTAPVYEGSVAWVGGEPRPLQIQWASGSLDWWTVEAVGSSWYPYVYSAPTASANHVFYSFFGFNTYGGGFSVVDRTNGVRQLLEVGTFRSPIWTGDTLYVVGGPDRNDQRLTARDENGAVLWSAPSAVGSGTGSPAIANGVVVVAGSDGEVKGYRASDGLHLWSHPVGLGLYQMESGSKWVRATSATPAIAGDVVWIGSLDGYLYALDLASGAELWKWYVGVPVASSAAISGNMLYVAASDGHLYAFVSELSAVAAPVSVGRASTLHLYPVRPNPGRNVSAVSWTLPRSGRVRVDVYDAAGRRVRSLLDEYRDAGEHEVRWSGRTDAGTPVASGVYFVRLRTEDGQRVRKTVRIRSASR